jgi:hypothetical protein
LLALSWGPRRGGDDRRTIGRIEIFPIKSGGLNGLKGFYPKELNPFLRTRANARLWEGLQFCFSEAKGASGGVESK